MGRSQRTLLKITKQVRHARTVNSLSVDAPILAAPAAIQECRNAGLNDQSPEITGILLRLAELYETKLNSPSNAVQTYGKVLVEYGNPLPSYSTSTDHRETQLRKAVWIAQRMGDIFKDRGDLKASEKLYEVWFTWRLSRFTYRLRIFNVDLLYF